ncbi:MFS transporter [Streptomyces sp. CCNWLW237]|uniref:MFS transporter n=1 Tax=Streptomyces sp. CCNWLW237 TaxID=3127465 RepID=UPI003078378D
MTDGPSLTEHAPGADRAGAPRAPIYTVELADAVGLGMYLASSVLFLNRAVDLSNHEVGLILGASGVASMAGAMPIARAAERFGIRNALCLLFVVRGAAFLGLSLASSFVVALLVSLVAGLLSRGIGPLIESAMLAAGDGDKAGEVGALARLRTLRNAGMAAGALPAGWAITMDERWAYQLVLGSSAVVFVCCAVVCRRFPAEGEGPAGKRAGTAADRAGILRNRPFLGITVLYGALTLSALVLAIGLPLWIVQETEAPGWSVTLCQLLNTVLVVLLQVRISRGSEKHRRARGMMLQGGILSALAAVAVPLSGDVGRYQAVAVVAVVAVLFTLAELYIVAGCMGAALLHIPQERRTGHLAAFNLGFAAATVIGPPLISTSLAWGAWTWSGWAAFFLAVGAAALAVPPAKEPEAGARTE